MTARLMCAPLIVPTGDSAIRAPVEPKRNPAMRWRASRLGVALGTGLPDPNITMTIERPTSTSRAVPANSDYNGRQGTRFEPFGFVARVRGVLPPPRIHCTGAKLPLSEAMLKTSRSDRSGFTGGWAKPVVVDSFASVAGIGPNIAKIARRCSGRDDQGEQQRDHQAENAKADQMPDWAHHAHGDVVANSHPTVIGRSYL